MRGRRMTRRADQQGVAPCRSPETAVTRSVFLEGATLGLGAAIGGLITVPVAGFAVLPALPRPEAAQGRPRPALEVPARRVVHRDLHHRPGAGRGVAADGVRPQQRHRRRPQDEEAGAELHDHLEPLRPPRLPCPGERPDRARSTSADGLHEHTLNGPVEFDPGRPGRLRLPVPRRPVRPRGEPHRRPAGARARPLRVRDRQRPPDPPQHVLGLARRGHRGAGPDLQVQGGRPGRARRRARAVVLSPHATAPLMATTTTEADEGRAPPPEDGGGSSSIRSTGSRSGRGSSAASGTSSSATSRRTSTGCRRSARRRSPRSSSRRSPA